LVGRLRNLLAQSDRPRKKSENLTNLDTRKPQIVIAVCGSDYINILKRTCSRVRDVVRVEGGIQTNVGATKVSFVSPSIIASP
jgi:hypothetical protein